MNLDATLQRELLDLLAPVLQREADRRRFVMGAMGESAPLLDGVAWEGAVEPFILRLLSVLVGRHPEHAAQALRTFLERMGDHLPPEGRTRLDVLGPMVARSMSRSGAFTAGATSTAMAVSPLPLRVFLASPGDVGDERALARQVLERLPYDPLLRGRIAIEVVAWDQPGAGVPMLATMTPQAAIAAGLPKPRECDIVVVIFWSRMGTPLPDEYRKPDGSPYLSGTEWEYLDALEASEASGKPSILVYRRTEEPPLYRKDPQFKEKLAQQELVEAFFAAFRNPDRSIKRGCNEYATPEDFRKQLELHLKALIGPLLDKRRDVGAVPQPGTPPKSPPALWQGSPFPGLRAFTPLDAPVFFGRGRETDELVRGLGNPATRFVIVVGASGSGKSSLVAAGLLPRLAANALEGSKDWVLPHVVSAGDAGRRQWTGLRFSPGEFGDNPFVALAARLAPLLPDESLTPGKVAELLEARPDAFAEHAAMALEGKPDWAELLVFLDQFEELFSIVDARHRGPFVDLLVRAVQSPRVRLVATIRADFFHRCLEWPQLAGLMREASFPLAAPGLASLFEIVVQPAARAGLVFDDGLPARILDETGADPGSLALLAFALHELYDARTADGRLTLQAYDAFDGVRGAISQRAEATFSRLPEEARAAFDSVFLELVEVDESGLGTRRRAGSKQVIASDAARALVEAFTDARLLVADRDLDGEAVFEVAHEALLREWPRLKDWITSVADDLRLWRQVEAAAVEWERQGRPDVHLWPHERLAGVYEAAHKLGKDRSKLEEPLESFIRPEAERLFEELERDDTTHYRRAEIGDRLDKLGDPRPGVGLRPDGVPDIVWRAIPPGRVKLEDLRGSFKVDRFLIAKYPITCTQYEAFLDDPDGYRSERWWHGLRHEPDFGAQYRPTGNCPAENVSWYDAMAYCRWLEEKLRARGAMPRGWESGTITLPTEMQWQQAATGGDPNRDYPWGAWVEGRANTAESRLSRTTAVGMYPRGSSLQDVLDLIGNVWELCLNKYDDPKDVSPDGEESPAARGGSWDNNRHDARCAVRSLGNPDDRGHYLGFRVACVAQIR
jgi:hypothetical protein